MLCYTSPWFWFGAGFDGWMWCSSDGSCEPIKWSTKIQYDLLLRLWHLSGLCSRKLPGELKFLKHESLGFEFDEVAGDHLPHGRLLQTSVDCSAVALLPWNCWGWEPGVLPRYWIFWRARMINGKRSWWTCGGTFQGLSICKWITDLKIKETLTKSWRHEYDLCYIKSSEISLPLPLTRHKDSSHSKLWDSGILGELFSYLEADAASWVSASFSTFAADSLGAKVGETFESG